ncbi:MAG: septum formation initiator family protein [Deferribacterales bacterium]
MKLNITFIIIIFILIGFLIFGHNGILKYQELAKIKSGYEEKIAQIDRKVEELNRELELVRKDREYLEMLIKQELNMKKSDEDLYIIEKKKPAAKDQKTDK